MSKAIMTATDSAKLIKRLARLETHLREEVEDKGVNGPFYSGFISYAADPVKEAEAAVEDYKRDWKHASNLRDSISQSAAYQQTARRCIEWAEEFLSEIKQ